MENEKKDDIITPENNDDIELDLDDEEQPKEEVKAEKPKLSDEEKLAKFEGITNRLRKKLGKTEETPKEKEAPSKSGDLDYGQKAFLIANGIKGDEISLVKEEMAKSGYPLDNLIENPYFQQKLKEHREAKTTSEAIPRESKRAATSARDSVEYWLEKPFSEVPKEMREKVLNAQIEKDKRESMFSDNPIVG